MNDKVNNITSKQCMVFILSAQIGTGILSLPGSLAKIVGHDGWISVVISCIISTAAILSIILFLKRYSDKSILEISNFLFGKYVGNLINCFLIIYLFLGGVIGLNIFATVIKMVVLRLSPKLILTAFIFIPTIYMTWYGLKVICRFSNILFFILFMVLFLFFLLCKNIRITFLMPIGEASISSIIKSIPITFYSYLGFEIMLIIYPNITDKNNALKYALLGNTITAIFYTAVVIFTTGLLGENMVKSLVLPFFSLSRYYKSPVFERVDLFFITLWFPAMGCSLRAYFFTTYHSINKMFHIKNKGIFYTIFVVITILLSIIPKNLAETLKYTDIFSASGVGVICFVIVCFIFSFINKRGVKLK